MRRDLTQQLRLLTDRQHSLVADLVDELVGDLAIPVEPRLRRATITITPAVKAELTFYLSEGDS